MNSQVETIEPSQESSVDPMTSSIHLSSEKFNPSQAKATLANQFGYPEALDLPTFESEMDRLIIFFTKPDWQTEVTAAKKEFFSDAGIMDEQSTHFDMRMTQFLDWYLLTRKLDQRNVTPAEFALEIDDLGILYNERYNFERLAASHHSLFEFIQLRGADVYVRDLFLDRELVVRKSLVNIGFSRDEIFDARLIPYQSDFVFAHGFCFHPTEAQDFINDELKIVQKIEAEGLRRDAYEKLLLKLMKMRYKYEQFRHLKLDYIYTNEKKVRF